ncbi:FHA domain-containing protein [Rhodococcus globerulus]|uniref:FHA domain-containing protein n=1 Tax=Rhodococcus globerulus TaxID=33008 RepID=UPI003015F688
MTTNIMWLVIAALIVILLVYYRKRKQAEHVPVAYDPEIEAPKNTVTDAIANAKNKFSRSAGLDRPRSSDTVITKVVDTAESAARSCPGGAKDMPSAIHVTMSRPQFEYVGKYLAEIRDHSTSGIRQRAREHGWPTPTTTVTIAVDDELAAPLRISTRFDTPFPQLGRATAKFTDQPAETVIEPRPSHDENPTPLLSDWQLILPNKTIVRLELNRWYNVGADATNDIVVADNYVSAFHLGLCATATGLTIEDGAAGTNHPSTNGTSVNGIPIQRYSLPALDSATLKLGPHTVITVAYLHQQKRANA